MGSLDHRFDYYQATVPAHHEVICRQLLAAMGQGIERAEGKGMWSYLASSNFSRDGEVEARVFHGGRNPHPNVSSTGEWGHSLAGFLRTAFPDHRVSRADVAIDMRGDGLFGELVGVMGSVGQQHRLKGSKIIPDNLDEGSTYYLGSKSSPVRVRCYEKGKQLYQMTGDERWKEFFDWTRLEIQTRPEKDFKSAASKLEPEEFWGCSKWTRELARQALAMDPQPVGMKPTRISEHERAVRALVSQYGPTIQRHIKLMGSQSAFLSDILTRLDVEQEQEA